MERFFNTAGPQKPEICYTIDPLSRFELDEALTLIRQQRYFVLHAPRQTGKTSCMLALRDYLNTEGDYIAVYANVEGGQASRNNVESVVKATVDTLAEEFRSAVGNDLPLEIRDEVQQVGKDSMLSTYLRRLSENLPKPIVLVIDEIDALVGDQHGEFLEMIPNAPIGLFPGLDYEGEQIDNIKGRPLFLYTDGLNEAENAQQEQLGDDRLISILRTTPFHSAEQVIETLKAEVETHRNGAEPNDDLTMMCLRVN